MPPIPRPAVIAHRTLVIGDSHGRIPMLREALRAAQLLDVDRVVSAGDFGVWPGTDGKQFLDTVDTMAAVRNLDVDVVAGNHDDYDQIAAAPLDDDGLAVIRDRIRVVPRGHVLTRGRWRWLCCGGAASIDGPGGLWHQNRGPLTQPTTGRDQRGRVRTLPAGHDLGGWWPDERITDDDVAACVAAGPADVLVTHEAALEVALSDTHKPVGDWPAGDEQRAKVSTIRSRARPAVTLSGHWHQHTVHRDELGVAVVLSADVNPREPQWAVVDDVDGEPAPVCRLVRPWGPAAALTGVRRAGATWVPNPRHQVVSDLCDADLRTA